MVAAFGSQRYCKIPTHGQLRRMTFNAAFHPPQRALIICKSEAHIHLADKTLWWRRLCKRARGTLRALESCAPSVWRLWRFARACAMRAYCAFSRGKCVLKALFGRPRRAIRTPRYDIPRLANEPEPMNSPSESQSRRNLGRGAQRLYN